MHIDILSLFPQIAAAPLAESIIGKAQERRLVTIRSHNIRDWTTDKHRTTDDTPYGGSQGMVLKCDPIFAAVEALRDLGSKNEHLGSGEAAPPSDSVQPHAEGPSSPPPKPYILNPKSPGSLTLLLTPAGPLFTQRTAAHLASVPHLILICGHYEGIDQRVIDHLIDGELSIGDYVLTNGALAAAVVCDAIVRLLPGVLGHHQSASDDSHSSGLLEFPQYTRPLDFRGWRVPDVLLSGHHAQIAQWRQKMAREKTQRVRPDLLAPDTTHSENQ